MATSFNLAHNFSFIIIAIAKPGFFGRSSEQIKLSKQESLNVCSCFSSRANIYIGELVQKSISLANATMLQTSRRRQTESNNVFVCFPLLDDDCASLSSTYFSLRLSRSRVNTESTSECPCWWLYDAFSCCCRSTIFLRFISRRQSRAFQWKIFNVVRCFSN